MNDFTIRMMEKVLNYLISKEGCKTSNYGKTTDSVKAIVTDCFGFRYEVQFKCIGRLGTDRMGLNENYDNEQFKNTCIEKYTII